MPLQLGHQLAAGTGERVRMTGGGVMHGCLTLAPHAMVWVFLGTRSSSNSTTTSFKLRCP